MPVHPVLAFPNFDQSFMITTDASEYALGAVLSQEGEKGDRPIAYASRRLTEAETRYSALERELLGIVWAINHFRPYVFGRKFTVHTDHRPLQWVGKMKESSARITRWKEFLGQYNLEIKYKPGFSATASSGPLIAATNSGTRSSGSRPISRALRSTSSGQLYKQRRVSNPV
ncbi:Ty3/Gypsy family RNase HI domain-containing protein, partial [Klebsiella pneumoniae]|uniref:Ty3/Gypsy family RNase HI domain-containing protein n=1 Tax=Klebsiella pneumoniae TaxID=573 RepID=UPI004055701E